MTIPNTVEALQATATAFGCTLEQARMQHFRNANTSRKTAESCRAKSRTINGYSAAQWDAMASNSIARGSVGLDQAEVAAIIAKLPKRDRSHLGA